MKHPPTTSAGHDAEFAPGASEWPRDLSRRDFLEVMAASMALAGLASCNRPPLKTIAPYVAPPPRDLADGALYYATAMPWEGFARGVLALSHSGRPTKLEGNPAHPDSLGATDAVTQASVLSLYDPDRSQIPRQHGEASTWPLFEGDWLQSHRELLGTHGRGLAVLTEPTTSPTLLRGIHRLLDAFPEARWYQHTPLPRYDRDGRQDDFDFSRADVILAIDADFLIQHPASLRYARAFANRRRIKNGQINANRLYVFEPTPTVTGSMADHRLPASPARIRQLLTAVSAALDHQPLPAGLTTEEQRVITALARDLTEKAPAVLCVAGAEADPDLHAWADAMNARFKADGVTRQSRPAVRSDSDPRCHGDLVALADALHRDEIGTLVVLGANPVYTAPIDLRFGDALRRAGRRIHLGLHVDETAAACEWHLPESHYLEAWSDVRAFDGTASIVQPLIAPLYATRSAEEFLSFLSDPPGRDGYTLVRETWRKHGDAAGDFDRRWEQWLNVGLIEGTAFRSLQPPRTADMPTLNAAGSPLTLVIRADPTVRDGRWANNGWLQELPKPMTQVVWDNAAHISPTFAAEHKLKNGDLLDLRVDEESVVAPVWILPGQAADCITVHLGYGRTHAGRVGDGRGFNAYRVRFARQLWSAGLSGVRRMPGRTALVSTQTQFSPVGRDIVRSVPATRVAMLSRPSENDAASLYPQWAYPSYRWAMAIDLGACIGCSACVTACQAENNVPVVGKEQVSRGRHMHWLRVDRYYVGEPANPELRHQPVPCMQCENAPCELVCPVAATVHSSEGLNDMVYNRCVGTRYCSNNCPYKVRRFNFFDFRPPANSPLYLQSNPEVSIRARGVMEKCTYCVQRIDAGRIAAEKENRRVRDGEIRTACQQACPADAIVFGDLNDPDSRVRAWKHEPTNYALLEELNTRPRTTYLARITNPNGAASAGAEEART